MNAESSFVGRKTEMARLQRHLDAVRADGQGRLLSIRGRRQAGKSRLVTEFVDRSALPQLFFTASHRASQAEELARFTVTAASQSTLPGAGLFEGVSIGNWHSAFRLLANALPDGPAIVVMDEFPWLLYHSPGLEGALQNVWPGFCS